MVIYLGQIIIIIMVTILTTTDEVGFEGYVKQDAGHIALPSYLNDRGKQETCLSGMVIPFVANNNSTIKAL